LSGPGASANATDAVKKTAIVSNGIMAALF
jgi:hypothetical protein